MCEFVSKLVFVIHFHFKVLMELGTILVFLVSVLVGAYL